MNPEERKDILAGKGKKPARKTSGGREKQGKGKGDATPMTGKEFVLSWVKTILGALVIVMIVNGLFIQSFVVPTGSMEREVLAGDFVFVNRFIYGGSTPQTIPFVNVPLPYFTFPGIRDPERGDVIVFIYPGDRDEVEADEFQYYLKRCVAVAGDTLEVRGGHVYVNGVREKDPEHIQFEDKPTYSVERDKYSTFPRGRDYTRDNWGPMRIPKEGDVIQLDHENIGEWKIFIEREGHSVILDGELVRIDGEPVDSYTVERDYVFGMGDNRNDSQDSRYWGFVPMEDVVGTPLMVYWSWQTEERFRGPDGIEYAPPRQYSLWERFGAIRWDRIFNGID